MSRFINFVDNQPALRGVNSLIELANHFKAPRKGAGQSNCVAFNLLALASQPFVEHGRAAHVEPF